MLFTGRRAPCSSAVLDRASRQPKSDRCSTILQAAPAAAAPKAGKGAKKAKFVLDLSVAEKDKLLKISDFVSAPRA